MASSKKQPNSDQYSLPSGGYECEFVNDPPDHLECPVCLFPFKEPHLLDCCGAKYCASCIQKVKDKDQPCPLCKQPFSTMVDKSIQRAVLNLLVKCSMKEKGCDWVGELRHLDGHEKSCEWALVDCECGKSMPRRQLAEHKRKECAQYRSGVDLQRQMETKLQKQYNDQIKRLETQLAQQKKEIDSLKAVVATMRDHLRTLFPPCDLTMTNYSHRKRTGSGWYAVFYSMPRGYKLCLELSFKMTALSLYVYLMGGENDYYLKWPFRAEITIQLLNHKRSEKSHEWVAYFTDGSANRMPYGERGMGWGRQDFIAYSAVESNTPSTIYIVNDSLTFRVQKIVML